jgi:hypothetical protein
MCGCRCSAGRAYRRHQRIQAAAAGSIGQRGQQSVGQALSGIAGRDRDIDSTCDVRRSSLVVISERPHHHTVETTIGKYLAARDSEGERYAAGAGNRGAVLGRGHQA